MSADIETIRGILVERKVIAVVGLSANWWRPSFFAAKYMQDHGYRIIPVNPNYEEVLGETCYPSLEDIPKDIRVDIVDVFQKPEAAPAAAKKLGRHQFAESPTTAMTFRSTRMPRMVSISADIKYLHPVAETNSS